jgi:hypothetical protein
MMAALGAVKTGGLFIFQHYRNGVPLDRNAHYLPLVDAQFRAHGARLLEAYYFRRASATQLIIGQKGDGANVDRTPALTTFHGRYPDDVIRHDIVRAPWPRRNLG